MFDTLPLSVINRLLAAEAWAAELLRPHAGQSAELNLGGLSLRFTVSEEGTLRAPDANTPMDLQLSIAAGSLMQLFDGPDALRQSAHIEGNARFAETLGLLLQHLRPDLAGHFAPLIGDIAAQRLALTANSLGRHAMRAGHSLASTALGAFRAPDGLLPEQQEMEDFKARLGTLLARLQLLETRLP